jgi:hypothetical protein
LTDRRRRAVENQVVSAQLGVEILLGGVLFDAELRQPLPEIGGLLAVVGDLEAVEAQILRR